MKPGAKPGMGNRQSNTRLNNTRFLRKDPMLTALEVRNAKARIKPYKLADGKGLFLHVATSGRKTWRYRYELPPGTERLWSIPAERMKMRLPHTT
jgi:hypothetical protein